MRLQLRLPFGSRSLRIFTTRQRNCREVMFLVLSIILFEGGVSHVTTTYDGLNCTRQGSSWSQNQTHTTPPPDMGPHCTGSPPQALVPSLDKFKLVHYEARTVGKRAVRILMKVFLVANAIAIPIHPAEKNTVEIR